MSQRSITNYLFNFNLTKNYNKCSKFPPSPSIHFFKRLRKLSMMVVSCKKVLFTDEKIFTVQSIHNHQNHRQLLKRGLKNTFAAKLMVRRHFPKSVMVWRGICATGKTPLVFIDRNVKINAQVYQQKVLKDKLKPWATNHFGQTGFTLLS